MYRGGKNGVARVTLRDTPCPGVPVDGKVDHGRMRMETSRDLSKGEVVVENSDTENDGFSFSYRSVSASISLDIQFEDPFTGERGFYFQCLMHQGAPDHSEAKREKYFLSLAKDRGRASPVLKCARKYLWHLSADQEPTRVEIEAIRAATFEWISRGRGGKSVSTANAICRRRLSRMSSNNRERLGAVVDR